MKYSALISLLLFFSVSKNAAAQNLFPSTSKPVDTQQVRKYYQKTTRAELAIIYNYLDSAAHYYQQAFNLKYPNGRDLYNAALVAYYRKDSALAITYFHTLAYKGLYKTFFKDSVSHPELYHSIMRDYDSLFHAGNSNERTKALNKFWVKIHKRDQRSRLLMAQTDQSDTTKMKRLYDQMVKDDSINMVEIKAYIETNGFPSFEQSGFHQLGSPDGFSALDLALWHWRPRATPIDNLILKAIKDGNFPPEEWASIVMARDDKYQTQFFKSGNQLLQADTQTIDKLRNEIYLPKLSDYQKIYTIATLLYEGQATEYNPNLYNPSAKWRHQFIFLPTRILDYPVQTKGYKK